MFDTQRSRARAIWRFVSAALDRRRTVIVVARPKHWQGAARLLVRGGWVLEQEAAAGRLVVLDAGVMLASFMRRGRVDRQLFDDVIGRCVSDMAARSAGRLQVYGEMVDLLAEEGNFAAAQALEDLWNGLARRYSFTLLCGYAAAHFTDPTAADALRAICASHTEVASASTDQLSTWVLRERGTAA